MPSIGRILRGKSFTKIERRGKLLIFQVSEGKYFMLVHLKMTGQLIYEDGKQRVVGGHPWPPLDEVLPNKYSHVIFHFMDGSTLYFNDLRQFGFVRLVDMQEKARVAAAYGVEPLSRAFTWPAFRAALANRQTSLKAALLNQSLIAGLGNIYVDEACWRAKVKPHRRADSLTEAEFRRLYQAIPKILSQAIRYGGTTFDRFRDSRGQMGNYTKYLKAYGRAGKACRRCKEIMLKEEVAQRGTTFCPKCQM